MPTRQERRRQERQTKKQRNEIPIQETIKMKEEYKDFVGIYDESVPVELCNDFVNNYEEAKKNRTIIDLKRTENSSEKKIKGRMNFFSCS